MLEETWSVRSEREPVWVRSRWDQFRINRCRSGCKKSGSGIAPLGTKPMGMAAGTSEGSGP